MRAARAVISTALNKMKKETATEVDAKLAEGRKKVEVELTVEDEKKVLPIVAKVKKTSSFYSPSLLPLNPHKFLSLLIPGDIKT
ncbi:hypothetical protein L1987_43379 [Smallanthus sonchifolius]|uniref:Uncharacterized protein n=1 Tax=Smallanthus sonchifolius TaxID=185202 RepID=A0ACB9GL86_9ASTR|nr:hypothetical protein L1987_43379 [Smallanthus sonchifolius]